MVAMENMGTVNDAAAQLEVHTSYIRQLCRTNRIEGAQKWSGTWMIPLPVVVLPTALDQQATEEPKRYPKEVNPCGAAKELRISRQRVLQLCQSGRIENCYKAGSEWRIASPVAYSRKPRGPVKGSKDSKE